MKYLVAVLLLVIAGLIIFDKDPQPDYSQYEFKLKLREAQIHSLGRDYEKLVLKIEQDSVAHTNEVQMYKDKDKKNLAYIANLKANPVVLKVRDSIPEISNLINSYDSLLASKDSQIYLSEKYIGQLQMDLAQVQHNFQERLQLQSETIQDQKSVIQDQRKQLRKERRKGKMAKVLIPVALVGGFLLGSSL